MPPEPKKPTERVSAKGRQGGDYQPPIVAEPAGGPIPTHQPDKPRPKG